MENQCDYGIANGCPSFSEGCKERALSTISEIYGRDNIDKEIGRITEINGKYFGSEGVRPRRTWELNERTHLCAWTNIDNQIVERGMDRLSESFDELAQEMRQLK